MVERNRGRCRWTPSCGPGLLLDYLQAIERLDAAEYHGLDLSLVMVEAARQRWPYKNFSARDMVAER
jgi:trans-aconitate methyltransferase